jgi:hypothetical protein
MSSHALVNLRELTDANRDELRGYGTRPMRPFALTLACVSLICADNLCATAERVWTWRNGDPASIDREGADRRPPVRGLGD